MTPKLTLNTRDELLVIDTAQVAWLQADGNYTHIYYMTGERLTVSLGLAKMEALLAGCFPAGTRSPFYRLGRSHIVNQRYLHNISLPRQKLVLTDNAGHRHELSLHKAVLKEYKDLFTNKNN
jgi:DNA-binding LytR/AlgR family response regulator